jgi:hypothetical protein
MLEIDEMEEVSDKEAIQLGVATAIKAMLRAMETSAFKMTVGEFVRLVEYQKENSAEDAGHLKVTWVDPFDETEYVSET